MAKKNTSSVRALRARASQRRRQQQRRRRLALGLALLGVVLIAGGVYWLTRGGEVEAAIDYRPEDVAHDRPLHAVHEMEPSNLASIPFLTKGGPQPKIVVSESFYNFGALGATDVVTHDFVIANQGDAPLTISRAYTTCGCTTADFSATVIPPGKVSIMTLTFDAAFHDVRGQTVRRGVIIENNDPQNPQVEIWTQASVGTN